MHEMELNSSQLTNESDESSDEEESEDDDEDADDDESDGEGHTSYVDFSKFVNALFD